MCMNCLTLDSHICRTGCHDIILLSGELQHCSAVILIGARCVLYHSQNATACWVIKVHVCDHKSLSIWEYFGILSTKEHSPVEGFWNNNGIMYNGSAVQCESVVGSSHKWYHSTWLESYLNWRSCINEKQKVSLWICTWLSSDTHYGGRDTPPCCEYVCYPCPPGSCPTFQPICICSKWQEAGKVHGNGAICSHVWSSTYTSMLPPSNKQYPIMSIC